MARPKKNGTKISVILASDIYSELEKYCDKTYLSKTAAIEKALREMFNKKKENE